ncbi:uncharacterized protein F5147DRAFT_780533 [Suillus discolor]|uniref:Uncharacterized protein n=1 Tax=Suillus discolor TaxID=1912936 RepID=A0A9P7ETR5_9AGAM|nr:uncharacterized protein F5147DRAFT_780533 [Suillus discolor]KAG2089740.1 hypothetical protein F5147DRAFT_780533 [Suillus discolor]
MTKQTRALYESVASSFSIWDAAHIFEYATSRFTTIHLTQLAEPNPSGAYQYLFVQHLIWEAECFVIPFVSKCAVMNINTSMPVYLSNVLLHITYFQMEDRNHKSLFARLRDCPHNKDGKAVDQYRVVPRYCYCWWKTPFHFTAMQMPLQLSVAQVNELTADHFKQWPALGLLIPEPITHPRMDDPLLQQLHVLQTEVAWLGLDLGHMLVSKLEATGAVVDAMNRLEQPLDEVYDAMAASQAAVDVLVEDYNNGRIGTSLHGDPFPQLHPFVRQ